MWIHRQHNPFCYYKAIKILGDGSMGSVINHQGEKT